MWPGAPWVRDSCHSGTPGTPVTPVTREPPVLRGGLSGPGRGQPLCEPGQANSTAGATAPFPHITPHSTRLTCQRCHLSVPREGTGANLGAQGSQALTLPLRSGLPPRGPLAGLHGSSPDPFPHVVSFKPRPAASNSDQTVPMSLPSQPGPRPSTQLPAGPWLAATAPQGRESPRRRLPTRRIHFFSRALLAGVPPSTLMPKPEGWHHPRPLGPAGLRSCRFCRRQCL